MGHEGARARCTDSNRAPFAVPNGLGVGGAKEVTHLWTSVKLPAARSCSDHVGNRSRHVSLRQILLER